MRFDPFEFNYRCRKLWNLSRNCDKLNGCRQKCFVLRVISRIQDDTVISHLTNITLDENKLNTYAFIMSAVWRPMSIFICKAVCSITFGYAAGSHRVKLVYQVHRLWNSTKNDVRHIECCFSSHRSRLSQITLKFSIRVNPLEIDLDHSYTRLTVPDLDLTHTRHL